MYTWLKHIVSALFALAAMSLFASCDKTDGFGYDIVYNGFGEISRLAPNGYFEITRDDGTLLRVVEYGGTCRPTLGERVFFKYNILPGAGNYESSYSSDERTVLDVKVIVFNTLYSAPIVRKSDLLEDEGRDKTIGDDPIRIVNAAFSGHYLNIGFEYFRVPEGTPHRINLVWDNTRPATDSVYLELRHNAMGETEAAGVPLVSETGLASFRLTDLVPEGAESINIRLRYNLDCNNDGYTQANRYITGTFHLNAAHNTYIAGDELFLPENTTTFIRQVSLFGREGITHVLRKRYPLSFFLYGPLFCALFPSLHQELSSALPPFLPPRNGLPPFR